MKSDRRVAFCSFTLKMKWIELARSSIVYYRVCISSSLQYWQSQVKTCCDFVHSYMNITQTFIKKLKVGFSICRYLKHFFFFSWAANKMLCEICTKSKTTFWWSQLLKWFHLFRSVFIFQLTLLSFTCSFSHLHFLALFCNRHFTLLWVVRIEYLTTKKTKCETFWWHVLLYIFAHDNDRVWALRLFMIYIFHDVDRKTSWDQHQWKF